MSLRFAIWLCAIIVGASSLASCQPPRPRIAKAEVPPFLTADIAETKDILTARLNAGHPR